jgi:hypothetical protein
MVSANAVETGVSCEFAVTDKQTKAARISPDRTAYLASGIGVPPNPKKGGMNKVGIGPPNHKPEAKDCPGLFLFVRLAGEQMLQKAARI